MKQQSFPGDRKAEMLEVGLSNKGTGWLAGWLAGFYKKRKLRKASSHICAVAKLLPSPSRRRVAANETVPTKNPNISAYSRPHIHQNDSSSLAAIETKSKVRLGVSLTPFRFYPCLFSRCAAPLIEFPRRRTSRAGIGKQATPPIQRIPPGRNAYQAEANPFAVQTPCPATYVATHNRGKSHRDATRDRDDRESEEAPALP